jgi:hypothetical protein
MRGDLCGSKRGGASAESQPDSGGYGAGRVWPRPILEMAKGDGVDAARPRRAARG